MMEKHTNMWTFPSQVSAMIHLCDSMCAYFNERIEGIWWHFSRANPFILSLMCYGLMIIQEATEKSFGILFIYERLGISCGRVMCSFFVCL